MIWNVYLYVVLALSVILLWWLCFRVFFFSSVFRLLLWVPHLDIKAVNKTVYAPSHPHISKAYIYIIHFPTVSTLPLGYSATCSARSWSTRSLSLCVAPTEHCLRFVRRFSFCLLPLPLSTRDFCETIETFEWKCISFIYSIIRSFCFVFFSAHLHSKMRSFFKIFFICIPFGFEKREKIGKN